jgi:hypothetical protein
VTPSILRKIDLQTISPFPVNAGAQFLHLVGMSGLARIAASLDHTSVEVGERDFRDFSRLPPM